MSQNKIFTYIDLFCNGCVKCVSQNKKYSLNGNHVHQLYLHQIMSCRTHLILCRNALIEVLAMKVMNSVVQVASPFHTPGPSSRNLRAFLY